MDKLRVRRTDVVMKERMRSVRLRWNGQWENKRDNIVVLMGAEQSRAGQSRARRSIDQIRIRCEQSSE